MIWYCKNGLLKSQNHMFIGVISSRQTARIYKKVNHISLPWFTKVSRLKYLSLLFHLVDMMSHFQVRMIIKKYFLKFWFIFCSYVYVCLLVACLEFVQIGFAFYVFRRCCSHYIILWRLYFVYHFLLNIYWIKNAVYSWVGR